jgi:DNA repair protein RecO (recombination protein O)
MTRVQHESAFVLHRYDFTESSVIVEAFTRQHGRVALIAKGAKKPSSNFRPILLPLQPLALGWTGDSEVRSLKGAEWLGGHVMPTGSMLWAGLYANELLLKLLARDDAHPRLFDVYQACVRVLAEQRDDLADLALRAFELALLRDIGLLSNLEQQNEWIHGQPVQIALKMTPEAGLQPVADDESVPGISSAHWASIEQALGRCMDAPNAQTRLAAFTPLMRACEPAAATLKTQLRGVLHYHCATPMLKTRQVMLELRNL